MPDHLKQRVLLVGAGLMAQEYGRVLAALDIAYDVAGRGKSSSEEFSRKMNKMVKEGGIQNFFTGTDENTYSHAIVTTGIDHLCTAALILLEHNIKNILLEKPGGMNSAEIEKINGLAKEKNANVLIAYNRRFYASTLHALQIIRADGGVSSFHFEFTEWSHVIEPLKTPAAIKSRWFLANSTHVVDLAFYLGGLPKELSAYASGNLTWHNHSKYSGAGVTGDNALFSYHANWAAPGRWAVEILTARHRLYFKPMESLQVQDLGKINITPVEIDDTLDKNFKPGLYRQTEAFLKSELAGFCTVNHQAEAMKWYNQMSGYESN
jgi:predicted dehydrogenase